MNNMEVLSQIFPAVGFIVDRAVPYQRASSAGLRKSLRGTVSFGKIWFSVHVAWISEYKMKCE